MGESLLPSKIIEHSYKWPGFGLLSHTLLPLLLDALISSLELHGLHMFSTEQLEHKGLSHWKFKWRYHRNIQPKPME